MTQGRLLSCCWGRRFGKPISVCAQVLARRNLRSCKQAGGGLFLLVTLFAVVLWLRPYALSIYHLERGGGLLEASLVPVYPDRLAPEQIVDSERLWLGVMHLEEAVTWDPRNLQALRLLGRAYLSMGQPEAALQAVQSAVAIRPDNPLLHLELADVYDSLGYAEEARQEYERGRVGSRAAPLVANYLKLADAQLEMGSGDIAIDLWRRTLSLDPGNLYALYRLAQIHRELGDLERVAVYEEEIQALIPQSVTVPLDLRLAEYQARAMIALVEDHIWERDMLLNIVSYQVQRYSRGLDGLMVERTLVVLLGRWPDDPDLLSYLAELRRFQ